jgi:hypothetical protein
MVDVDAGSFGKDGDTIELFDPKDTFGKPGATTNRRNGVIRVPVRGEFTVLLLRVVRP